MLNIEKYKDDILNTELTHINCCVNHLSNKGICFKNCKECKKNAMKWLLSEYKEPVIDDVEREYLSAVIKPFRKKISCIRKNKDPRKGKNYIKIEFCDGDLMFFPNLSNNAMYKGMKLDRNYTLEELGL
jgi:hypothetical protein